MGDLPISLWDALGLALLGISAYMILVRVVIPRFASPWVSKRRRLEAITRAEELLGAPDLDEESRYRLQRCLNTVRAHDAQRESWSGQYPISDIVEEIDSIWENQRPGRS